MSRLANIDAEPVNMPPMNEDMMNAVAKWESMSFQQKAQPAMNMDVDEQAGKARVDEELISQTVKSDPHMNNLVSAVDEQMNTAMDVGVPQKETFEGLVAGIAGSLGKAGQMGFVGFMASTADDLDKILGVDDSEQTASANAIAEPKIEAPAPTPEQAAQNACKQIDWVWMAQLNAITQAKNGNPELLESVGLDQTDIEQLNGGLPKQSPSFEGLSV